MTRWVDVNEDDWFFNEVTEASNIILEDGEPFVSSIVYNVFKANAPYIYEEQKVGSTGKKTFTLQKKAAPTNDNPLLVYIDGIRTVYKDVKSNAGGTSDVELYAAPRPGAIVSFSMIGEPVKDRFEKPSYTGGGQLPSKKLDYGDTYHYDPFSRQSVEYLYAFGRALRRLTVSDEEWRQQSGQAVAQKYIGLKTDVYVVSPADQGGYLYLPYNLDGVTCNFTYHSREANGALMKRGGEFKCTSTKMVYNNRFFPNAIISRGEAFLLIDRLRRTFYSRFTDLDAPTHELRQSVATYSGQMSFKLNGYYDRDKGLVVRLRNVGDDESMDVVQIKDVDYTEIDGHSVLWKHPLSAGKIVTFIYKKLVSTRFEDVGKQTAMYNQATGETTVIDGSIDDSGGHKPSWWALPVIAMENEQFADGKYLIEGFLVDNFTVNEHAVVVSEMNHPVYSNIPSLRENWFMPHTPLTRAEAVSFLNRFRKWGMERFK
ncbi:hypothetical protein [Paenibacillus sp. NPDC058071]|uniref:hypothetical protein n=1 Tax=Paenibacillus sp. NPDC058071 TaxID=3346326 RepID=UPI0036DB05FD